MGKENKTQTTKENQKAMKIYLAGKVWGAKRLKLRRIYHTVLFSKADFIKKDYKYLKERKDRQNATRQSRV